MEEPFECLPDISFRLLLLDIFPGGKYGNRWGDPEPDLLSYECGFVPGILRRIPRGIDVNGDWLFAALYSAGSGAGSTREHHKHVTGRKACVYDLRYYPGNSNRVVGYTTFHLFPVLASGMLSPCDAAWHLDKYHKDFGTYDPRDG